MRTETRLRCALVAACLLVAALAATARPTNTSAAFLKRASCQHVSLAEIEAARVDNVRAAPDAADSPYANFFINNVEPSGLPRSYFVPEGYYDSIPSGLQPDEFDGPMYVEHCGGEVSADAMNAYTFETERYLASVGLNIYDGSVWQMASYLTGNVAPTTEYLTDVLLDAKTLQFASIKGDRECAGALPPVGTCHDRDQDGSCGFCYGANLEDFSSRPENAFSFRMISDYFCLEGTTDARCPSEDLLWCWTDWKPIAGENAWSPLIGPLNQAYWEAGGDFNKIDDDSVYMQLATNIIPAMEAMWLPAIGGVFYAPVNTWSADGDTHQVGLDISTENNISILSGLKMLKQIIEGKAGSKYANLLPTINDLITGITAYMKAAADNNPSGKWFLQGGSYNISKAEFTWNAKGDSAFAVDCQTWAIAVLGVKQIDEWWGPGTALAIWHETIQLGGYQYNDENQMAQGVGFSYNDEDQVFSGEWSLGAVNALRAMLVGYENEPATVSYLTAQESLMMGAIKSELQYTIDYNGVSAPAINYANKRYFIPFGWWANPIPSMASTGWMVFMEENYNPFQLGGGYPL